MKIQSESHCSRRESGDTWATDLSMYSSSSSDHAGVSPNNNCCSVTCCHSSATANKTADTKTRRSSLRVKTLEESLASVSIVSGQYHHNGQRREVSFCCAEFREYETVLGDNPCPRQGCAVSLGWKYNPDTIRRVDVIDYEWNRPPTRSKSQMLMPPKLRTDTVLEMGFTWREILNVMTISKEIRTSRAKTASEYTSSKRKTILRLFAKKRDRKLDFPIPRGWRVNRRYTTAA